MIPFTLPADYPRIKRVGSFEELVSARFEGGVNALCWERVPPGDFSEVVERLHEGMGLGIGITVLDDDRLAALSASVSEAGRSAIEFMLEDLRMLRAHDRLPELNAVNGYRPEEQPGPVRTDVCSFHVDSATAEADTWLCTYHGAPSEGLRNDEAVLRASVAETRAALLEFYRESFSTGDGDDEAFQEWLGDHAYDLHYAPLPGAQPFSFGVGNLWRIAVQWDGCPVPACIHRAPEPVSPIAPDGQRPEGVRLLLIS